MVTLVAISAAKYGQNNTMIIQLMLLQGRRFVAMILVGDLKDSVKKAITNPGVSQHFKNLYMALIGKLRF